MSAEQISNLLGMYSFSFQDEAMLQSGVELALKRRGVSFLREHRLTDRDRLDFFCSGIAVECKVSGSVASLVRQLHRYAQHPDVTGLVVITNRAKHHDLPQEINGKPLRVCSLLAGGL